MKKLFCTILICFVALSFLNAQNSEKKYTEFQYEKMNKERVCPSKIISLEGDTFRGFLKIMTLPTPRQIGAGVTKGAVYS